MCFFLSVSWVLLSIGHTQNFSKGRCPGSILIRCLKCLSVSFWIEAQWFWCWFSSTLLCSRLQTSQCELGETSRTTSSTCCRLCGSAAMLHSLCAPGTQTRMSGRKCSMLQLTLPVFQISKTREIGFFHHAALLQLQEWCTVLKTTMSVW